MYIKINVTYTPTNNPASDVRSRQVEYIVLAASVVLVAGFDLEGELLYEGTSVDGFGVRVGIPCFLLHL